MPRNFLPGSDAGLLSWTANFATRVAEHAAAWGVPAARVAGYVALQSGYAEALRAATDPTTRTVVAIRAKDAARQALTAETRRLARTLRGTAAVSEAQRIALGLGARPVRRKRVPRPRVAPALRVAGVEGGRVELRLINRESPERRGRPVDVGGAYLYRFVGAQPPRDEAGWSFCGGTTAVRVVLEVGAELEPGETVWFTARWRNYRDEKSPWAEPVRARVGYEGMRLVAA